uniref:Imm1 family immunity protein n=1 Tax=Agathobacter sp. TaxID=2021311 RepID=UPI004056042B
MNIANENGDFICNSWDELENLIRKSTDNPYDDIWIYGDMEYPCLGIWIHGDDTCVHYFLNDQGDMWQSVGYGDKDIAFMSNGETSYMPANCVISLDKALACAKQFYETLKRPDCTEWREL